MNKLRQLAAYLISPLAVPLIFAVLFAICSGYIYVDIYHLIKFLSGPFLAVLVASYFICIVIYISRIILIMITEQPLNPMKVGALFPILWVIGSLVFVVLEGEAINEMFEKMIIFAFIATFSGALTLYVFLLIYGAGALTGQSRKNT